MVRLLRMLKLMAVKRPPLQPSGPPLPSREATCTSLIDPADLVAPKANVRLIQQRLSIIGLRPYAPFHTEEGK